MIKRRDKYYVYIVECKNGTFYTGYTHNLKKRIETHNKGRGAKYLHGKLPVKLVYSKEYRYYKNALNAEREIKMLARAQKEKLIEESRASFHTSLTYAVTHSPLGYFLLASTDKGICHLRIGKSKERLKCELKTEFPAARLVEDPGPLTQWTEALRDYLAGHKPWPLLPCDVRATAFQRRVWEWLRTIPAGTTYNYSQAAKAIGRPQAARAAAGACAANPAAIVIPCHRILPKSGGVGGYRWNPKRKQKLLKLEQAECR